MGYHLSKNVKNKIELYISINSKTRKGTEGFLIGGHIGNLIIIEDIFFIPYNSKTIEQIYPSLLEVYGKKFLGPVFINKAKFNSDWFNEDLILEL